MTEAGIVSTCVSGGHGGTSGGREELGEKVLEGILEVV